MWLIFLFGSLLAVSAVVILIIRVIATSNDSGYPDLEDLTY